jgi:hypothetical protein
VQAHLLQLIQRLFTRSGLDDAKVVAIFLFQVGLEFMPDLGESVNDDYCGLYQILLPIWECRTHILWRM